MTEKELRKLSRLDLLELLLEQTKINEQLRAEIAEIRLAEGNFTSIENLQKLNSQLSSALEYTDSLKKKVQKPKTQDGKSDRGLYSRIMYFYLKNDDALASLPADLQEDIRERLRKITNENK